MGRGVRGLIGLLAWLAPELAQAQVKNRGWFPVPSHAAFQTGDSWMYNGLTYRLWGVQSCLRGSMFTNNNGQRRDCGEASLAMLVALIRDLKPQCYAAAEMPQQATIFVICVATRSEGAGAGARIDLGTALIATGFAFAALRPEGTAVHDAYAVAQNLARSKKTGLWAFADMPDPNATIWQSLRRADGISNKFFPHASPKTRE